VQSGLIHSALFTFMCRLQSELSLYNITFLLLLALFPLLFLGLPKPNPSPPTTIPAFPEQSNLAGCPWDLPSELFHGINSACDSGSWAPPQDSLLSCSCSLALKVIVKPQKTVLGEVCIYRNCAGIVTVGNNNWIT